MRNIRLLSSFLSVRWSYISYITNYPTHHPVSNCIPASGRTFPFLGPAIAPHQSNNSPKNHSLFRLITPWLRLFLCFPRGGHANDGRQQPQRFRHFLPQTSNRRRDLCAAENSSCWQKAQHLLHKPLARVPRNLQQPPSLKKQQPTIDCLGRLDH